MTTTFHPATTRDADAAAVSRRSPRRGTVAVLVVAVAVVVLRWLATADAGRPVLAIAQPVAAGMVLTADDVHMVRVDGGSSLIPAGQRETVVGRAAAVDLLPGTLLVPGMLADAAVPGPGEAVVGLTLPSGAVPAELRVGARVRLVGAVGDDAATAPVTAQARLLSSDADQETATVRLSLLVADGDAAPVVRAAAADALHLVLLPPASEVQ